jgi:DNA-binding FrmR family transcriptional regulator
MTEAQLRSLGRTLAESHDDAACMACLDQLDAYAEAQLAGQPYTTMFPLVAHHLDSCVRCAEDYARVYEARLEEASAVAPATARTPDLGFLTQPKVQAPSLVEPSHLRERLRADRFVAALRERVVLGAGRLRVQFDRALLDVLPTPQQSTLAFRDAGERQPSAVLTVEAADERIAQVHIHVYDDPDATTQTLRCVVALHDREWPELAGVVVRVLWDEDRREGETDAWGEVVFEALPHDVLARMTVEVDASDA